MSQANPSMSLSNPHPAHFNGMQKTGLAITAIGLFAVLLACTGLAMHQSLILLLLCIVGFFAGGAIYAYGTYGNIPEGIKNNRTMFSSMSSHGALAWIAGIVITAFYILLYWREYWTKVFGTDLLSGLVAMFDPLSRAIRQKPADQWFLYGSFYTIAVLVMGFKFILKYRHNTYQIIRTCSVMTIQLGLAWLLPAIMLRLKDFEPYLSYFWPLDYDALFPGTLSYFKSHPSGLGTFVIFWGLVMTFVATPILTYFFGKRWYCSWFCGCGGLAETAGDPFRHLSDKSLKAWKVERWLIHSVLAAIVLITALLLFDNAVHNKLLGVAWAKGLAHWYGFAIGMVFSGVVGVGFYPIMGSRVWCRFGCPMAAYMGLIQRFKSRFRITTNGGQCISCGNCSTYCEMGIDVRWYAQRGQNIVRASCVGCGICSAVCPRGVLKLESGPDTDSRLNSFFSSEDLKILS
ncbi:MAG: 4Fe-4S binding protein [Chitinophagales bacterium]